MNCPAVTKRLSVQPTDRIERLFDDVSEYAATGDSVYVNGVAGNGNGRCPTSTGPHQRLRFSDVSDRVCRATFDPLFGDLSR